MSTTVRTRIYRQGFGDCILLKITEDQGQPFWALIDCGVFWGTKDGTVRMVQVAQNIREETGDRLDLLIMSHEHWDHVSGFKQAKDEFAQISVDKAWLAWTEDASDAQARRLKEDYMTKLAGLRRVAGAARGVHAALPPGVTDVLGFFGNPAAVGLESGPDSLGFSQNSADALRIAREDLGADVAFCDPTKPPRIVPEAPWVRWHVLGPPRDENLLKLNQPADGRGTTYEVRHGQPALDAGMAFLAGASEALGILDGLPVDERAAWDEAAELTQPFHKRYRNPVTQDLAVERSETAGAALFDEVYGDDSAAWRRIDDMWLAGAGELALQMDSYTNNTSLALALELTGSGKVLLFSGDAQVGNWLSWHERGDVPEDCSATNLLGRTVLYKVGHHGSHNATLKDQGLELMRREDLVALIPTDPHMWEQKSSWHTPIPHTRLLDRLAEKTRGRVVQVAPKDEDLFPADGPGDAAGGWSGFDLAVEDMWVDYTVTG